MLDAIHRLLAPAAVERATLLANHVIASEPAATQRMQPHAGRCVKVQIDALPAWLPPPPALVFAITPAGLLEWKADPSAVDLSLRLNVAEPMALARQLARGEQPAVTIEGDAALAADVGWLMANLRWDLAADLERFLPPAFVQQLVLAGRALRRALGARA